MAVLQDANIELDPQGLFLQVKQAQRSVLELTLEEACSLAQGRRVVEGQRMMQAASDIFLGWTSDEPLGIEFHVRILKNCHLGAVSELAGSRRCRNMPGSAAGR